MITEKAIYSLDAEIAVLGVMLGVPDEIEGVLDVLNFDDFFVPAHREIFKALADLFVNQHAIDGRTIHQWLVDRKIADQVGSPGILGGLLVGFATHLNLSSYIEIVRQKSQVRQLQSAIIGIASDIGEMQDAVSDLMERAEKAVLRVTESRGTGSFSNATACVSEYEDWRGKIQRGEIESRLKTGLRALDETNGGLPVPSYVVIAGEQGVGKSALILNLMKNACIAGTRVGGFTMEMTTRQCTTRLVADIGDINSRRLVGKIHPDEEAFETFAKDKIRQMPFILDPTPGLTPQDLRASTRRLVKSGCKIVWLDNAQLTAGSSRADKRVDQLTEISRTIQQLQKEHDIVFILLAQVTREGQKRGNLRAFDLADCAAFERDARVMVMLEKKPDCENAPSFAVPIMARVVKYSEGETGDFECTFNKQKQRIT